MALAVKLLDKGFVAGFHGDELSIGAGEALTATLKVAVVPAGNTADDGERGGLHDHIHEFVHFRRVLGAIL